MMLAARACGMDATARTAVAEIPTKMLEARFIDFMEVPSPGAQSRLERPISAPDVKRCAGVIFWKAGAIFWTTDGYGPEKAGAAICALMSTRTPRSEVRSGASRKTFAHSEAFRL